MKQTIQATLSLLMMVAVVMGLAWMLPLWATVGIVLLVLLFNLAILGLILRQSNGHGKEE